MLASRLTKSVLNFMALLIPNCIHKLYESIECADFESTTHPIDNKKEMFHIYCVDGALSNIFANFVNLEFRINCIGGGGHFEPCLYFALLIGKP